MQVFRQRQVQIDGALRSRADNQLFHVHIWRIQETALIAYRHDRQRVRLTHRRHAGAFDGIDGDIYRIAVAGTDALANVQHRRFVDFAFANHDSAVDVDQVEHNAHGVDGGAVGGIFITAA